MGWLTGWDYRKGHVISYAAGAGTDYQVKITVYYGAGTDSVGSVYCGNKCKSDFSDIRFTDDNGSSELYYWRESYTAYSNAVFWVKVTDSLESAQKVIYMYYGKSDATTTSDGNNTFLTFIDTEEGDITDWTGTSGVGYTFDASTTKAHTGTYSSRITAAALGAGGYFYKDVTAYGYGYAIRGWFYDDGDASASNERTFRLTNTGAGLLILGRNKDQSAGNYVYYDGGWHVTAVARTTAWHLCEFRIVSGHVYLMIDSTQVADISAISMEHPSQLMAYAYRVAASLGYYDDVAVRKFVATEPAHGEWSGEETDLGAWSYWKSHAIAHAAGAGTNYQVRIVVHYGAGVDSGVNVYCDSKCKTDFGDIRFTEADQSTLLDYWMEQYTDSTSAVFWVEIRDSLTTNDTTIYMYYGNDDVATTSNGVNTFILFDDFESYTVGSQIPTTGIWGTTSAGTTCQNAPAGRTGKVARITGIAQVMLTDDIGTPAPARLIYFVRRASDVLRDGYIVAAEAGTQRVALRSANGLIEAYNGGAYAGFTPALNFTKDTWHRIYETVYVQDVHIDKDGTDYDGASYGTIAVGIDTWQASAGDGTYTGDWYYDDFCWAKYVATEPAHGAWGSEESLSDWTYFKTHVIGHAAYTGVNYQIKIIVHYGAGEDGDDDVYCNSHCETDFDDIRFTADDGTFLDYWMVSKVNSNNAVFWVEIRDDLTTDDVTIYLRYGNAGASSLSNFDNTFIFGDPLDSATLNTDRWTTVDGNPVYTIDSANHYIEVTDMDGTNWETGKGFHSHTFLMPSYWLIEDAYDDVNGYLEYFLSTAAGLLEGAHILAHAVWATADLGVAFTMVDDPWDGVDTHSIPKRAGVGGNADYGPTIDILTATNYWKMYKKIDGKIYIDDSGTNRVNETNTEVPDRFHLGISRDAAYVFGTVRLGAFKIRKYVATEPVHGVWGDEHPANITKTITDLLGGLDTKSRVKELYRTITDKLAGLETKLRTGFSIHRTIIDKLGGAEGGRNFGYEGEGGSHDVIEDTIKGSIFTSPPTDCVANTISMYLVGEFDNYVNGEIRGAIYKLSDLSFVGETERRVVTVTLVPTWFSFNFVTRPALTANTDYILVAWAKNIDFFCCMCYDAGFTDQEYYEFIEYNGFPDPLVADANRARKYSIYCTTSLPARTKGLYRSFVDLLSGLDTKGRVKELHRTITDILGSLDTKSKVKEIHRTITDLLGALDTKLRIKELYRTITDLLAGLETKSRIKEIHRTITDKLAGLDSWIRSNKTLHRVYTDLLGSLDVKSRVKEIHRTITDLLGGLDIKERFKEIHRVITDKLGALDTKLRVKGYYRIKTELLGALDSMSYIVTGGIQHIVKTVTELLGALDTKTRIKSYYRIIIDSLGALESKLRIKEIHRIITELLGALDTKEKIKEIHRIITDKLAGLDTISRIKELYRMFTDLLGGLDVVSRIKEYYRIINDSLGSLDVISRVKEIHLTITDLLGALDIKSRIKAIHRTITDLLGAFDIKGRVKEIHRVFIELLGALDSELHATVNKIFKTVIESLGALDTKLRIKSLHRTITDLLGILESKERIKEIHRTIIDKLGALDTWLRSNKTLHRIFTELFGGLDIISRVKSIHRTFVDLLAGLDVKSRVKSTYRSFVELLGALDIKSRIKSIHRTFIDLLGGLDVVSRTKSIYRTFIELLGGLDIITRIKGYYRIIIDKLGGFDTILRVKSIHRTIIDLLSGLDIKERVKSLHRTITDLVGMLDIKSRIKEIHRIITDLLGALDIKSRVKEIHRTITDLLAALDTIGISTVNHIHKIITEMLGALDIKLRIKEIHRSYSELLGALDILSRVKSIYRTVTDLIGALDIISRIKSIYRIFIDSLSGLDVKSRVKSIHRTVIDLLGALDTRSKFHEIYDTFVEVLGASDTISRVKSIHRTLTDLLGGLDTKLRVKEIYRTLTDLLGGLDVKGRVKSVHRSFVDLLGGLDIKERVKTIHRTFIDKLSGLDIISKFKSYYRIFIELLGAKDVISKVKSIYRTIIESLGASDTWSRIKSIFRTIIERLGALDVIRRVKLFFIRKILKGETGRVILEGQDGRFQLEGESGRVKLVGRKEDIIFKGEEGEVILDQ